MIIVCDLDGTLCDCSHRQSHALAGDWDNFHAKLGDDEPNPAVLWLLRRLLKGDSIDGLIFLTGRPDEYYAQTVDWLWDQCGFGNVDDYIELLMRPKDDWRSDVDLKPALLQEFMATMPVAYMAQSFLILEDRDKVVAKWRDLGYTCFQVAEGVY